MQLNLPCAVPPLFSPSKTTDSGKKVYRCSHRGRRRAPIFSWLMSAGGAFGGTRGSRPVPPEKGVFPLDHMHQCDLEKKEYLNCLKSGGHKSDKCRVFSRKYLECRMQKNLMAKQDMSELGFGKETIVGSSEEKNNAMAEVKNNSGTKG